MRWDELFADIEGQLEQELDAERIELAAEEERLRIGRLTLRDRILAMAGPESRIRLVLSDGEQLELRVDSSGRDWIAGEQVVGTGGRTVVVPLSAVDGVIPAGDQLDRGLRGTDPRAPGPLAARLGLPVVLRELCRRRAIVELRTALGGIHGTIDRVGRDHLDLAEHDADEPRRRGVVRRIRIVPLASVLAVRVA